MIGLLLAALCLSATQAIERFVPAGDGVQLFVREEGQGPPVVVLHGGPGLDMNYLVADLARLTRRYRVIYFDQRGSGRSTPADRVTADVLVSDLEAVRQHLGLERLTLVGHSWGSGLAALYALAHPDRVERLALIDVMPARASGLRIFSGNLRARLTPAENARLDVASAARDKAVTEAEHMESCRAYWGVLGKAYYADPARASLSRADFCAPPSAGIASGRRVNGSVWLSLGDFDWRARLGAIKATTLVIHGDRDPIPLDLAREWRASVPGSRLVVVPDAGHMAYVEQPDIFFGALETFLDGTWPDNAK